MPSLESLIPEIAAYQQARGRGIAEQGAALNQVGALQGIMQKQQAMQEAQEAKELVTNAARQAGGDPAKMVPMLMQAGPLGIKLASELKGLLPKPAEDKVVAPGGAIVDPSGTVKYQAPFKPDKPDKPPEIVQLVEFAATLPEGDPRKALIGKAIEAKTFGREEAIRLAAALRAPPQPRALQLTTDAQGNQLIVNPDGTTRPLTTEDGTGVKKPVAADKPMTEFQGKAALYGTRGAQSDKVLRALEDKISTAGLAAGQATGVIGNALMSSEQQRVNQAQRDFVNAVLRQESGAVISDAEFENAKKQYFPTPGDTPQVVAQKRANRQLAIQGFARMSGPKGAADIEAILKEPLLPGVSATNPTPKQAGMGATGGWKITPIPQ